MLTTDDGYALAYYKNRNRIEIFLPQTPDTVTNTTEGTTNRKTDFSDSELCVLLLLARKMCKGGDFTE